MHRPTTLVCLLLALAGLFSELFFNKLSAVVQETVALITFLEFQRNEAFFRQTKYQTYDKPHATSTQRSYWKITILGCAAFWLPPDRELFVD